MTSYKKGSVVKGTVTGIENYGAFVSFDEYYSGLIHISEISHGFVKDIKDFINVGDVIYVEILDVDEQLCQLKLSIKNITHQKAHHNKKINETSTGFQTLEKMLPKWIEDASKRIKQ
jgi:general stress protein 13